MYGVVNGVYYCHKNRTEELNKRIYERNIPSSQLQMNFDPRSVQTRYVKMPILDCRMPSKTPIRSEPVYNQGKVFNPGSSAPYSGYATNIDNDSRVKNIFFPNQTCAQAKFIPGTQSDLFKATVPTPQPSNSLLFHQPTLAPFNPNKCNLGYNIFYNHTKQQVKDMK